MKIKKTTIVLSALVLTVVLLSGTVLAASQYDRCVLPDPEGGRLVVFTKGLTPTLARILRDIFKNSSFPWQLIIKSPEPPVTPAPKPSAKPPAKPETPPVKPEEPEEPAKPENPETPPEPPKPEKPETPPATGLTAMEQQMLDLINAERAKAGAQPLVADMRLTEQARLKSQDMIDKGYFSHQSPTYGSPFDQMAAAGITYRTAGENLAGAPSVASAHENLMLSDGHRRNILNPAFDHVGIGIIEGGPYGIMFTQMFIGN